MSGKIYGITFKTSNVKSCSPVSQKLRKVSKLHAMKKKSSEKIVTVTENELKLGRL
jgi:hypothetical protein